MVIRAEALDKELDKSKNHSALLESKLDGAFTQYYNELQDLQEKRNDLIKKNKTLRKRTKVGLSTQFLRKSTFVLLVST
jgi:hypothetical protein